MTLTDIKKKKKLYACSATSMDSFPRPQRKLLTNK